MVLTRTSSTNILNSRPILLSADSRRISYKSKSGKVLTLELKSSANDSTANAEQQTANGSNKSTKQLISVTNVPADTTASIMNAGSVLISADAAASILQAGSALVPTNLLPDIFDTVSFWCMEAVECAMFGPYEELAEAASGAPTTEPPTPMETPMTEVPMAR